MLVGYWNFVPRRADLYIYVYTNPFKTITRDRKRERYIYSSSSFFNLKSFHINDIRLILQLSCMLTCFTLYQERQTDT